MAHPSIRVFQHPFLERLTHVHPIIPLLIWGPVAAFLWMRAIGEGLLSGTELALAAAAGVAVWTMTEYLLHRFIFHFMGEKAWQKRLHFLIHGLHHDDPQDPTRLVMPPAAAIILAVILYSAFRLVLGSAWIDPFFSFFLIGYLGYDYIHYATHHVKANSWLGRNRVFRAVKQAHMDHHFREHHAKWGVSSPLWDHIFGTFRERKAAPRVHKQTNG